MSYENETNPDNEPWPGPETPPTAPPTPATDPFEVLLDLVKTVSDTQERMQEQVESILDDIAARPDGPWMWTALEGSARRELWERLFTWVTWLEDRYLRYLSPSREEVVELPADWYRHPVAVELLTSLMVAHAAAYRKKAAAPSFALVDWHERALWPTLLRMKRLGLFPKETEKQDWDGPELSATRRNEERWETWMAADVDAHSDPADPIVEPLQ